MLEIIDTIKILGLQVETENYLNRINISLNINNVIQQLTKYNKYRYRFVLESFLFSSNFENETDVTFLTCNRLSNAKEALINSKIENVLGVTYLSKILNWELAKGQTKRSQAIFVDSEYHNKLSHLAFAFVTRNITDLISFTVALLDDNRKKLTFPSNETKFQQLALELKLQDRQMSRKMNDDKAAEVIKNLFADFKILASKVNDDNKNRKKKLDETKKVLEACKQEYQKLLYEHNALKKYCELEQKLQIQIAIPKKRKRKYYIVNQNNYKSDRESDPSTDENEIETKTDDNDDVDDDDYDETIKKERNKKNYKKK